MNKNLFVVNFEKLTYDDMDGVNVDSGCCNVVYTNKKDAVGKMNELADDYMNEHLEELDECDEDKDTTSFYRDTNTDGCCSVIHHETDNGETIDYKIWVEKVQVKEN